MSNANKESTRERFERDFKDISPKLQRYFSRYPPYLVEDPIQEAFIVYYEKLQKGEHIRNPEGFVFVVANRALMKRFRKEGYSNEYDETTTSTMTQCKEQRSDQLKVGLVLRALPELTDLQGMVFLLSVMDYNSTEIAIMLMDWTSERRENEDLGIIEKVKVLMSRPSKRRADLAKEEAEKLEQEAANARKNLARAVKSIHDKLHDTLLRRFLKSFCNKGKNLSILCSIFKESYQSWLRSDSINLSIQEKQLTKKMKEKEFELGNSEGRTIWKGLDLKERSQQ